MDTKTRNIGFTIASIALALLVIMLFVKRSYDEESAYLCKLISDDPDLEMEDCPAHKSNASWMIMLGFGVAMLALGIGVYLMLMHQQPEKQQTKSDHGGSAFKEIDTKSLDEDENKIYSELKAQGGSVYQSDLVRQLGIGKVKLTRLLDRLEQKGILERKRRGMTNLVVLR